MESLPPKKYFLESDIAGTGALAYIIFSACFSSCLYLLFRPAVAQGMRLLGLFILNLSFFPFLFVLSRQAENLPFLFV